MRDDLDPATAQAFARGLTLHRQGRLEDAAGAYGEVLALQPGSPQALLARGAVRLALGEAAGAAEDFGLLAAQTPHPVEADYGLGQAELLLERPEPALAAFDRYLAARPGDIEALKFRGRTLQGLRRFEPALTAFEAVLSLAPADPVAAHHRGEILTHLGRLDEGLQAYRLALQLAPDQAESHCALGLGLLRVGQFAEGYREWEWRKRLKLRRGAPPFTQPVWTGAEPIAGKTLLVHAEQGLGDTIQFARYVPGLAARGAKAIFAVQNGLPALISTLPGEVEIIDKSFIPSGFDRHCALLSLPLLLGEQQPGGGAAVPYLRAQPARIARWAERVGPRGFKVGLVWRVKPVPGDTGRSLPLADLAALADIPGVRLISLHRAQDESDADRDQPWLERLGEGFDAGPDIFADAAGVMQHLDLVISVDTSLLHLAGALGRPVWGAIQRVADWRWGVSGETSAWYPTLRLFRQSRRDDWSNVIEDIAAALAVAAAR